MCLPSLYYGLEAYPTNKSQINFVLNCAFRKIFITKSRGVPNECIRFFSCSVSDAIKELSVECLTKLQLPDNTLCNFFTRNITDELAIVAIVYLCSV